MEVAFRPLREVDLPLVHEWLGREHVRRWWGERGELEQTVEHYGPSLDGRDPTDLYAILVDGCDVGMIQTYVVADYPDYARVVGVEDGVAGVDLFLGDERLLGRGLGTRVIGTFVEEIVFARKDTHACVADPDVDNVASLRAFEKAGFVRVREFVDPEDGRLHALVRRDRARAAASTSLRGLTSSAELQVRPLLHAVPPDRSFRCSDALALLRRSCAAPTLLRCSNASPTASRLPPAAPRWAGATSDAGGRGGGRAGDGVIARRRSAPRRRHIRGARSTQSRARSTDTVSSGHRGCPWGWLEGEFRQRPPPSHLGWLTRGVRRATTAPHGPGFACHLVVMRET